MMFWIGVLILVLAALAWPLYALLKQQHRRTNRNTTLNIAIYRDRLDELQADLENGTLDKSQFETAKSELARSLLQDLGHAPEAPDAPRTHRYANWVGVGLLILTPLVAFAIYDHIRKEIHFVDVAPNNRGEEAQIAQREVRRQLFQLQTDPDHGEAWVTLGRAYMIMGLPAEALQSYERAIRLQGESAELLVSKAHAMARLHDGNLEGQPEELIRRALALDPDSRGALTWAGMVRYQHGDYAEAIRYWERLLALLPENAEPVGAIRGLIAQARKQQASPDTTASTAGTPAQASPTPPATPTQDKGAAAASINVAVSLDSGLQSKVKPEDTVFILARASEGPRMPLAIVKKQVRDLPLTVKLDDSMAMMPQMKLSAFPKVTVVARVSKAGTAKPQTGDLYGEKGPLSLTDTESVDVIIGSTIP